MENTFQALYNTVLHRRSEHKEGSYTYVLSVRKGLR